MYYSVTEPENTLHIAEPEPPGRGSRWQQYLHLLSVNKVPEKSHRYYVKHVEDLLGETEHLPLLNLRRDVVEGFLQKRADNPRLADWQLRQCVDAIRLLLVDLAKAPVCAEIDWDAWRLGAKTLSAGHATLAHEQSVGRSVAREVKKMGLENQQAVLEQLVVQIRTRHYSIRTEKAYLNWAAPGSPVSRNALTAMRSDILSPRICSSPGTISAPCRSCWDMLMCRQP